VVVGVWLGVWDKAVGACTFFHRCIQCVREARVCACARVPARVRRALGGACVRVNRSRRAEQECPERDQVDEDPAT